MPSKDKPIPTLNPDQLMDRVSALSDPDKSYVLHRLATCGSEHPDGQALPCALAAVEHHRTDSTSLSSLAA